MQPGRAISCSLFICVIGHGTSLQCSLRGRLVAVSSQVSYGMVHHFNVPFRTSSYRFRCSPRDRQLVFSRPQKSAFGRHVMQAKWPVVQQLQITRVVTYHRDRPTVIMLVVQLVARAVTYTSSRCINSTSAVSLY